MKNKQTLRHYVAMLCTGSVLVLCACSGQAWGYQVSTTGTGLEIRWPTPSAGFYINTAGGPSGSLSAIKAALQTWTNVSASNFSFAYKGTTTSTNCGSNDGTNITCFGSLGPQEADTLALNTYWFDSTTGYLADSDIEFNTDFAWATDSSPSALDVQTIAVHELGHALSLADLYGSGDTAKVMYGSAEPGEIKRVLTQDDMNGIIHLYPGGAASTTTTTAPSGTTTTTILVPGGSCPAAYALGQDHPYLEKLRAFRDGPLAHSAPGRRIIRIYYDNAGSINAALERSSALRSAARGFFEAAALLMADKK